MEDRRCVGLILYKTCGHSGQLNRGHPWQNAQQSVAMNECLEDSIANGEWD